MEQKSDYVEVIQGMRFIGALSIVIYHSLIFGNVGYFGVEIFCIISGYIMMLSTEKENAKNHFLRKRLFRILPLYWLLTIITYAIVCIAPQLFVMSEAKLEYLIKSMFFIPFVNSRGYDTPMLSVGWTLNYEMFFYIIFMLAMHLNHKYRGYICGTIMLGLVVVGMAFDFKWTFAEYYTDSFLLEFVFGIMLYNLVNFLFEKVKKNRVVKIFLILFAMGSYIWMWMDLTAQSVVPRCFRIGIPALVFLGCILLLYKEKQMPKWLVKLGNMSFSLYLVEYFSTALYKILVAGQKFGIQILLFVCMLVGTIVVSNIVYQIIEVKFTNVLKKRFL